MTDSIGYSEIFTGGFVLSAREELSLVKDSGYDVLPSARNLEKLSDANGCLECAWGVQPRTVRSIPCGRFRVQVERRSCIA